MTDRNGGGAKAYFLGPKSENEAWARSEFQAVLDDWFDWRKRYRAEDPAAVTDAERFAAGFLGERERMSQQLDELKRLMRRETPTYSPRYAGHMVSELTLPALLGHFTALLHNPNNTSKEVSRVGTVIEAEAIRMLAGMVGFDPDAARGHFTSGGTVANFEGVWRARYRLDHWLSLALWIAEETGERLDVFAAAHMGWARFAGLVERFSPTQDALRAASAVAGNPADVFRRISAASGEAYLGPVVLVPGNKHFSWRKAANVFGLGEEAFWSVALDEEGRLDLADLERRVDQAAAAHRPILAVITVAGTTETGEIDPIDRVADRIEAWRETRGWRIWHHVDAAYGGFLCTIPGGAGEEVLDDAAIAALRAIGRADSVTIDPHKLGYVPYACGAFLARDADHYAVSVFDAPYLERPHLSDDLWSATLEGSRPASGAAAVWLTGRTLGFEPDRFGALLAGTIESRLVFQTAVEAAIPEIRFLKPADTNIVCFSAARKGEPLSASNRRTQALYDAVREAGDFFVSATTLTDADQPRQKTRHVASYDGVEDDDRLTLIRCVFMNPYWSNRGIREALIPNFIDFLKTCLRQLD
ncbi:decarboxylase [Marinicauda salina]|uniref:Decarboxylase n=1 Tax=Marinicauda salina TaxID=2135793 RepID=A0A2U2BVP9_9PROT|nr:pyridoxal-dependent decarboxylase [Marinicauda salina]PWE18067.1 decarboxylase [Marinicauda salina]